MIAGLQAALTDYARRGAAAWMSWMEQRDRLRLRLASLINAPASQVALSSSTSRAIADLAVCMPWRAGDRIVLLRGEFPTNVTPWQQAARRHGLEIAWLPAEDFRPDPQGAAGAGLDRLEALLRRGVRLLAVSAVQFQTGLRMPVGEMARLCRRYGAEIAVDAIQLLGSDAVDVASLGVDYLVAGSHKWLMGPEGCALLYCAAGSRLEPNVAGWLSHEDSAAFLFREGELRYDRPLRPAPGFLEIGAFNTLGFAGWEPAVEIIARLDPARIFAHVQGILDPLERGLVARGFVSLRSAHPSGRSCILSARPPAGVALPDLWRGLTEAGIACSQPDGCLRFSPHWPNSADQVPAVLEAVDRAPG